MFCASLISLIFLAQSATALSVVSSTLKPPSGFAAHNFGPASSRLDNVLYSAERPGNPPGRDDKVTDEQVIDWIAYVRSHGVTHVIALLDENELANYSNLPQLYRQAGLQFTRQSMNDSNAAATIFQILSDCENRQERVVTHCTGGIGRCGRVCAGWLCVRYGLTPQVATEETLECARTHNINRAGNADLLVDWLQTNGIELPAAK
jgi:protein-tyrosine phosphatase